MLESPPPYAHPPGSYGSRPPAGPVPTLALVAALCLAVDAVVLPWISWGFRYLDDVQLSNGFSLWTVVTTSGAASVLRTEWMTLVAVGIGCAAVGSVVELAVRPASRLARWLAFGGFAGAVGGSCIGLLVGVSVSDGLSGLTDTLTTSFEPGFWVALALSAFGTVLTVLHLSAPPNPSRMAMPFAPSPWGPPPGVLPPGFHPSAEDGWAGYAARGQLPPGYVPPSYGPPVFPSPGFITPAYMMPGGPGPMFGPAFPGVGIDPSSAEAQTATAGAQGSAPGRLTVLEDGQATILTVQPGQRLLVGRDADAEIRVSDRKVSERHATIERRGVGWAVQDVDAMKPTRLIDPWGMHRQVRGETEIPAGQVVVGDVVITLYPGPAQSSS